MAASLSPVAPADLAGPAAPAVEASQEVGGPHPHLRKGEKATEGGRGWLLYSAEKLRYEILLDVDGSLVLLGQGARMVVCADSWEAVCAAMRADSTAQAQSERNDTKMDPDVQACDHTLQWAEIAAVGVREILHERLTCQCGHHLVEDDRERRFTFDRGNSRRKLGITDVVPVGIDQLAASAGYGVYQGWLPVSETAKRARLYPLEPAAGTAVTDAARSARETGREQREEPAVPDPSPAGDGVSQRLYEQRFRSDGLGLPACVRVFPLDPCGYDWAFDCNRHGGAWEQQPDTWQCRTDAEHAARLHGQEHQRAAADVLTPEQIERAAGYALSSDQLRVLGWIAEQKVHEFPDGFWALDVSPSRFDVTKRISRARVINLRMAGWVSVHSDGPGVRLFALTDLGQAAYRLVSRAVRTGVVRLAQRDSALGVTAAERARYPLLSEGRRFANETGGASPVS